ncbi:MAG: protein phosphatase CheZ [Candidatus Kapabacteria bacterium]|nr:protein phosphatase CheZ [Ignavibacteriota bacterium]MCW5884618.1 protein phosphatase CheZ [Candidatus Kapabacteria bacterium]
MIDNEIKILLRKADELRALFVLGQKVIPFLEEIFVFVSEIQPLLDDINNSIRDNLKRMPNASKQLSKVTEATELATNEIMDLVDGIVFNSESIATNITKVQKIADLEFQKPIQILELVYDAIENGADVRGLLPEMKKLIEHLKQNSSVEKSEIISNTKEILRTIQSDSSSIMMSLQVQDITSQQIAAVNKLLETVQDKLNSILHHFKDSDLSEMISKEVDENNESEIKVSKLHREIAFDPNAVDSIANKEFRQTEVDEYIRLAKEGQFREHDSHFADLDEAEREIEQKQNSNDNTVEHKVPDSAQSEKTNNIQEVDDFESISQEDIDKMFNS